MGGVLREFGMLAGVGFFLGGDAVVVRGLLGVR